LLRPRLPGGVVSWSRSSQRPALYAVDEQGIVRYAYLGSQQWQLGDVDEALAALGQSVS